MNHLSIIGCGTLGRAVLGGLFASGEGERWTVRATVRTKASAERLTEQMNIEVGTDNTAAAREADVILLGVKPQSVAKLVRKRGFVEALEGKLVISMCAGVRLKQLRKWMPGARVIRSMPNTPALVRQGMTTLSPGKSVTERDLEVARNIFRCVGRVQVLEERYMDVVTGLSGSGPAFAMVMLEALADGGVMMGLPRDVAIEQAAQTLKGAAELVLQTQEHPAALRDKVTTPAGSTIAGLFKMEEGRIRSTLALTVQEAARVAASLGGED